MIEAGGTRQTRLAALDAFRGFTVAAMILVTNPGTYSAVYPPLLHSQWSGATATDLIFPSFLVATGLAMTLSFTARIQRGANAGTLAAHAVRRSAVIFIIGLLLNGFPDYHWQTIRIPGVLQRIAICYLLSSLLLIGIRQAYPGETARGRRTAMLAAVSIALLALYWAALKVIPVPGFGPGHLDSYGSLPAYLDRAIFGIAHLWPWGLTPGVGVTFDPEGLLSTIPALATLLFGVLAGEWMFAGGAAVRRVFIVAISGALLMAVGLALHPVMPLIKKIWTPSFALMSGGFALLAFASFYFVCDVKGWRAWTRPAAVFGTNAILAFALSGILTTLADRLHIGGRSSLHQQGYQFFAAWLSPIHASLVYSAWNVVSLTALAERGWTVHRLAESLNHPGEYSDADAHLTVS